MKIEQDNDIIIKQKRPHNKIVTIISILIILTILIVIGIVLLMIHVEDSKLSVSIDGKKVTFTEDTFLFVENTGELYVSIQDIAPLVGYEAHNGEYKVDSEDTTKMYVEAMNRTETTSFYLNSRLINKVPPDSEKDYEGIQISAPVIENKGKLYVNAEGFTQGFNSVLVYDKAENDIAIQTLPYLVNFYTINITNYGFDKLSEDFCNQKALVYGMVVGSKQTTGKYGVKNARTNADIIGSRYNKIEFIEGSSEFIITNSSGKVGIAHSTGETKVNVQYDEIKVLDGKLGYYIVKSNSKYGVINAKEELIVHIEYDGIGVNTSEFSADKINNQFILYNEIIPVYLNGKWGLFNIKGEKIAETEYDSIGCINEERQDKVANNAIIVGDTKVIIVGKDGLYGGVSTKGDMLLPVMFEDIYSLTSGGETIYYMTNQGTLYRAKDLIDMMKSAIGGYEEDLEQNKNENKDNQEQNANNENQEQNQVQNEVQNQENVQTSENNTARRTKYIK